MVCFSKIWNNKNYVTIVSIIGLTIIFLNLPQWSLFKESEVYYFIFLCIIASNSAIQFKSGINMTLTSPVSIFLLLILDINTALFIGSLGILSYHLFTKRSLEKVFFNIAQYAISVFLSGSFLYLFYERTLNLPDDFLFIIPAILLFELINLILVSCALASKSDKPLRKIIISGLQEPQIALPLYLSNGLIMFICYQTYGLWGLTLIIIPLFSVNWLLHASASVEIHKENSYLCPTTKLKNKRCLNEWLKNEFSSVIADDQNISFVLIDIDNFKQINDEYGHEKGNQVLAELSELIKKNISETDLVYRYGGEEFVIIFPSFKKAETYVIIERFRKLVNAHIFSGNQEVTFSAGIATLDYGLLYDRNLDTAKELIRRADMAMYSAKQSGKNQTQFFKH